MSSDALICHNIKNSYWFYYCDWLVNNILFIFYFLLCIKSWTDVDWLLFIFFSSSMCRDTHVFPLICMDHIHQTLDSNLEAVAALACPFGSSVRMRRRPVPWSKPVCPPSALLQQLLCVSTNFSPVTNEKEWELMYTSRLGCKETSLYLSVCYWVSMGLSVCLIGYWCISQCRHDFCKQCSIFTHFIPPPLYCSMY